MSKQAFIAAVATLVAAASFSLSAQAAGDATPDYPTAFTTNASRSAVQTAAINARQMGIRLDGEQSLVLEPTGSVLSRAQVKAETLEAIRVGAISRNEQSVSPTQAQLDSIRMAGLRAVAMQVAAR